MSETERRLREALAFARSVIKSGESWSATCEEKIDGALRYQELERERPEPPGPERAPNPPPGRFRA